MTMSDLNKCESNLISYGCYEEIYPVHYNYVHTCEQCQIVTSSRNIMHLQQNDAPSLKKSLINLKGDKNEGCSMSVTS